MEENDILKHVEHLRLEASKNLDSERKFRLRQYFGNLTVENLSRMCRPEEKDELNKFLKNMSRNLNSVTEYLSKH